MAKYFKLSAPVFLNTLKAPLCLSKNSFMILFSYMEFWEIIHKWFIFNFGCMLSRELNLKIWHPSVVITHSTYRHIDLKVNKRTTFNYMRKIKAVSCQVIIQLEVQIFIEKANILCVASFPGDFLRNPFGTVY